MIQLYAIQARFGDCFLIEYGEAGSSYILIDGGPPHTYEDHLRPALNELMKGQETLDDVIISHVDNDHIVGVLDLLTELQVQHDTGVKSFLNIGQLWFNSFSKTIGTTDILKRIAAINTKAGTNGLRMQEMNFAVNGIREGGRVLSRTKELEIPVNQDAENGFYLAAANRQTIKRSNIEITVVGPTLENLKKLQVEWEAWIKENEQKFDQGEFNSEFAAVMDRSVPNLSSIVLLIKADGISILLTGDCRGDHLQQGLIETGLSVDGKLHVDIFKVPHHGSKRNITKQFFKEVTADIYVISADGTYKNPDDETLYWIVEAARETGRKIKLVLTNETISTAALLEKYKPEEVGYEIEFMKKGQHSMLVS